MIENIRLSLKGIWSHKLRSFLTMLGIIIGIASIIAIVSTIQGTNEQIKNNLIGDGTNTVTVTLYQDGWTADFSYSSVPEGIPEVEDSVREELLDIDGVERITVLHSRSYADSLFYKNTALTGASIYGIDADYFEVTGMQITDGRGFSERDLEDGSRFCILDKTAVSSAFAGDDPIGKIIDINGDPFVVIGVAETKSSFEPVINSIDDYYTYADSSAGTVYIPDKVWPTVFRYDEPQTVVLKASSTDEITSVGKAAAELLNGTLHVSEDVNIEYKADDLVNQATQLQQLSNSTNAMLIGIAAISLLVGGIGVMNIMLVTVTERTREIGLKKALGARKRTILGQFLTEAAMLSSIGGVIGIFAGIGLAQVVAVIASVPVSISIPAAAVAVVFSMVVGIVFGFVPSVKAANLNPIDALRYE